MQDDDVTYELWEIERDHSELMVACVSGPAEDAFREIKHYAMVYGQDGPVEIRKAATESTSE